MQMKKVCAGLAALSCVAVMGTAQAESQMPTWYGTLHYAAIDMNAGDDWHLHVSEASVGLQGMYVPAETDAFKMVYNFEIDGTGEIGASDGFEVSEATLVFITPAGKIITATGTSGHHVDLYGAVDIWEQFDVSSAGVFYSQGKGGGTGVLAYATPSFGGFYLAAANVNIADVFDDNDEISEAQSVRLMYKGKVGPGKLTAGVGYAVTSEKVVGVDDYSRTTFTLGYDFDAGHHIGMTYEDNSDSPIGDFSTLGIVAAAALPMNLTLKAGYYTQDDVLEGEAMLVNLTYQAAEQVYFYVEYSDVDDTYDVGGLALGVVYSF